MANLVIKDAVGGAMGGGLNYSLNAGIQGGFSGNGLAQSMAIGGASGMVGGGVGAGLGGAIGALGGGFAGGATGSALSGARGMDIVYGGLTGAGVSLAGYSAIWGYNNYSGGEELAASDLTKEQAEKMVVNEDPSGQVAERPFMDEAYERLQKFQDGRSIEVGGSFRVRTTFWSGDKYLAGKMFEGGVDGVSTVSRTGDHFRLHLHTPNGTPVTAGSWVGGENYASGFDYGSSSYMGRYGISSYFANSTGSYNLIGSNLQQPRFYSAGGY